MMPCSASLSCLERPTRGPMTWLTAWRAERDERGGSREVRNRDGAAALSGVPRHRPPVLLRGGDRAAVLPRELGGPAGAQRRRRGLLRGDDVGCVGVGHVPPGALRQERPGGDVQGR